MTVPGALLIFLCLNLMLMLFFLTQKASSLVSIIISFDYIFFFLTVSLNIISCVLNEWKILSQSETSRQSWLITQSIWYSGHGMTQAGSRSCLLVMNFSIFWHVFEHLKQVVDALQGRRTIKEKCDSGSGCSIYVFSSRLMPLGCWSLRFSLILLVKCQKSALFWFLQKAPPPFVWRNWGILPTHPTSWSLWIFMKYPKPFGFS